MRIALFGAGGKVGSTLAPALERAEVEAWLAGQSMRLSTVAPRGLIAGLQKSGGMFGIGTPPTHRDFSVLLVLPAQ